MVTQTLLRTRVTKTFLCLENPILKTPPLPQGSRLRPAALSGSAWASRLDAPRARCPGPRGAPLTGQLGHPGAVQACAGSKHPATSPEASAPPRLATGSESQASNPFSAGAESTGRALRKWSRGAVGCAAGEVSAPAPPPLGCPQLAGLGGRPRSFWKHTLPFPHFRVVPTWPQVGFTVGLGEGLGLPCVRFGKIQLCPCRKGWGDLARGSTNHPQLIELLLHPGHPAKCWGQR